MATDSIVAGLFSDPNTYEMQQLAQQRAMNERTAQLTPEQQVSAGLRTAGYQLGQGVGGLMGAQDPQMRLMSIRNSLARQFDINSPEGLIQYGRALQQAGDLQGAAQIGSLAREASFKESQITKNLREGRAASVGPEGMRAQREAQLQQALRQLKSAEQTPEVQNAVQLYTDELNALQRGGQGGLPAIAKLQSYRENLVSQYGENSPKVKEVDQAIKAEIEGKAPKINVAVPIGQVFDKFFTQKSAEEQAKNWDLYGQAYSTLPATREKLSEVRNLIDQSFSGTGANVKLGASKLARSLNLPIDVNKASNTEIVEALTTQFAISELKKNFGSNPAVKDFEAQLKVKPGILQEPETFKKLVDKLDQGLQAEEIAYRQGKAYQKANKGSIDGFDPYAARADATSKLIKLNKLMGKAQDKTITESERQEAKKLQGELNAAQ